MIIVVVLVMLRGDRGQSTTQAEPVNDNGTLYGIN